MNRSKLILSTLFMLLIMAACSETEPQFEWETFGAEITPAGYVEISDVVDGFTDEHKEYKITGVLTEVCQSKGCWTVIDAGDNRMVRMTFENYGFFLPTDAAGKIVIAEGVGYKSMTSLEELRHFAEDAGSSEEEINAITEAKVEYQFEARGVLLR